MSSVHIPSTVVMVCENGSGPATSKINVPSPPSVSLMIFNFPAWVLVIVQVFVSPAAMTMSLQVLAVSAHHVIASSTTVYFPGETS